MPRFTDRLNTRSARRRAGAVTVASRRPTM
jgi:hypothetical protein